MIKEINRKTYPGCSDTHEYLDTRIKSSNNSSPEPPKTPGKSPSVDPDTSLRGFNTPPLSNFSKYSKSPFSPIFEHTQMTESEAKKH